MANPDRPRRNYDTKSIEELTPEERIQLLRSLILENGSREADSEAIAVTDKVTDIHFKVSDEIEQYEK